MFYLTDTESERLKYRPLTRDDISLWTEFTSDPVSLKYFENLKGTPEEIAEFWIIKQLKRYEDQEYGMCALISKDTEEFIGQAGLLKKLVDGQWEVEIGYSLLRKYTGKGYATEAANHLKAYGFRNNFADSIISLIHVDNLPSQEVAKRNGMKEDKRIVTDGMDLIVFRTRL